MRPYRAPGSQPLEPDKTPVVLTYGPFTLKKDELGKWSLEAPASFESGDLSKLSLLVGWAQQTSIHAEAYGALVLGGGEAGPFPR